jgi:hypothetical protein
VVSGTAGRVPVPDSVRVTRAGHPMQDRELVVWGQLRRRGQLLLVLVLPDGSKKQIPASWTDLGTGPGLRQAGHATDQEAAGGGVLASVGDLLHLREVISGLAARIGQVPAQAARQSPAKEDNRAAHAAQSAAGPGSGTTSGAGQPAPRDVEVSRDGDPGPADRPGGPGHPRSRTHRPARAAGGEVR